MNKQREACCDINEVVNEHYGALQGYALKKVGDGPTAEDIVQEVMYRAAKVHAEGAEVSNPKAWLYQTTRHVIADHFRNKARGAQITLEITDLEQHADEGTDLKLSDGMVHLIKLLPEEYAMPLHWSDIDNIPQREIARRLGIGLSAAKMRIHRARKKLHGIFMACCDIVYDRYGSVVDCTIKDSCEPLLRIEAELHRRAGGW
ncbi:sigma-70 family RNA polymerase sigma factor [Parapedobacter tibetensis]|uniref:sigma-70 family RNA polymerase sigma factor n=1 Tax=Parapedobacter tibetensis TaxID=2972951 RepID=UPI00214D3211|nr:sigma-70 family RNA polymerase sigma factor [Parapedobacter tibetensis]